MELKRLCWTLIRVLLSICVNLAASEEWIHRTVLDGDGRYHVYWNPPAVKDGNSLIVFKIEVQTHGYVGFGLSPNGGMAGSDMVIGWIKKGKTYFQDRHAKGNALPLRDAHKDWNLIESGENDTHTVFKFSRKLDTCDKEDYAIDDSTMRIIYAYSEEDPESEDPMYHFKNRGSKSVMLLQTHATKAHPEDNAEYLHWDIRSPNFTIPTRHTMYLCKIYKTPQLAAKHHIVQVKPLIQEGHEEFVHHMLLYECVGGEPEEYESYVDHPGHECYRPNMPDAMRKCEGVAIGWAVGGENLIFPEHVGLPLEPAPGRYFMLELHYDNQQLKEGIVDNSGLRIYYTPKLRKHDAGTLMVGTTVTPRAFIPPHQKEYTLTGHSNPDCLALDGGGIRALGVILHSHLIGKRLIARHFRKNKELPPLAVEKNYDFNYQEYRYFTKEVDIFPGDQITVECTYDSSKRNKTTFGGHSTQEEMCLAFVLYYPRMNRYASLSVPTIYNINKVLHTNLTMLDAKNGVLRSTLLNYDWKKANISDVEHLMRFSDHDTHCYLGNGTKNSIKSLISYPSGIQDYTEKSSCQMNASSSVRWNLKNVFVLLIMLLILLIL